VSGRRFIAWLIAGRWRSDQIGALGVRLVADPCLPKRCRSAEKLLKHLRGVHGETRWDEIIAAAVREWIAR
jgi:hypothetical protein